MGRKSKLTEVQWQEIERRLLKGDSVSQLARDFEVGRTTITDRCPNRLQSLKDVANQIVAADVALKSLPIPSQVSVMSLVDDLKAVSYHLAGAAKFGAATAHRLAGIANNQVELVDDAEPEKSSEALARISALSDIVNKAGAMGLNLLNANKEGVKIINNAAPVPVSNFDPAKLSNSTLTELLESRVSQ